MSRDEFVTAGLALFGEIWIGPLADASGVSRRSIARMAAGKIEVPADLAEPLRRASLAIGDIHTVIDRLVQYEISQSDDHSVMQRTRALLGRSLNRIFDK